MWQNVQFHGYSPYTYLQISLHIPSNIAMCLVLMSESLSQFTGTFVYSSVMWLLQLLAALSGLVVIAVLGQNPELKFADPPPLPEKGIHSYFQAYMSNLVLTLFGVIFNSYKMHKYSVYIRSFYTYYTLSILLRLLAIRIYLTTLINGLLVLWKDWAAKVAL